MIHTQILISTCWWYRQQPRNNLLVPFPIPKSSTWCLQVQKSKHYGFTNQCLILVLLSHFLFNSIAIINLLLNYHKMQIFMKGPNIMLSAIIFLESKSQIKRLLFNYSIAIPQKCLWISSPKLYPAQNNEFCVLHNALHIVEEINL